MPWKWKAPNGVEYLVTDRWSPLRKHDLVNMEAEVAALDGRHPKDVFGEDVPLGEISFTDWSPDTCGCVHRYLMRPDRPDDVPIAHRAIQRCAAHQHHEDHAKHFGAIYRENKHKNDTIEALANKYKLEHSSQISFEYDDARNLVVFHWAFGEKKIPLPRNS